ncbi:putative Isotrichodermin C-15 hydroxylase [Glarea lozoyensis 74030]|uniref:Putative Isotrichodermin C-15 hydroxylase n=1 Tax=Glarea lozoyensis (strain ATCC 74030 / MF5533) TaxID=1104152 RepID=H0EUH3_GLAL7|nr:putative Isotrichodermin C-15 hydroxylase [Glarea lozoyensis 74030]
MTPAIKLDDGFASPLAKNGRFVLACGLLCVGTFVYTIGIVVYRLWFHPLSKYPGPFLNAVSEFPATIWVLQGRLPMETRKIHAKYGSVVRLSPNELAFNTVTAWQDIYGHRNGRQDLNKHPIHVGAVDPMPGVSTISMADNTNHARQRKALSHGFSKKALWEQEGIIQEFVDKMMLRFHEFAQKGEAFDIVNVAGSETTASTLASLTNNLLRHPEVYSKLKAEIREKFSTEEEIKLAAVNELPYLSACIEEGLRIFPPAPIGFLRMIQDGGDTIDGQHIPGGTAVSVSSWCAHHSPDNFKDPDDFIPERWLKGAGYDNDNKLAHRPFSLGPRGCIGKDLSYVEMRLVLAKMIWNFDLVNADNAEAWNPEGDMKHLKAFSTWQKPELQVYAEEVKSACYVQLQLLFAAIQTEVATSLGNSNDSIWFIPSWSLAITVMFTLAGANTDLLGRRYFLMGGNVICTIGHLIIATAKTGPAVTAGMAITGFGAANCQMAAFAVSELLPNKWRHWGVVLADIATLVAVVAGPVTARYGLVTGTWRWNFYPIAILQAISALGLYLFYYPPKHPNGLPYRQVFKEMDYGGMILFIAGAGPFLAGIIYTTIYPSSDVHVIAPLVTGAIFLVLYALWENIGHKLGWVPRPLTPTRVFTAGHGRDFTAPCIGIAVINMFYYSSSLLWPTMINVFYLDDPTDWRAASILSLVQGFAICAGVLFLTLFGAKIKHWNWQLAGYVFVMVLFGVLLALGNPGNKNLMIAFVFISQAAYGPAIYLAIAVSQMGVEQKDLGLSGGVSGTARFAGGAIATSVYTAVPEVIAAVGKATQKAYERGIQ